MVAVNIEDVDVDFPFAPYECQVNYMSQVIKSLTLKCDAALESPTGTGKTLSLLCSSLAWLQKEKLTFVPTLQNMMSTLNRDAGIPVNLLPKIYYCSRTHSQLAQVVRELNKTIYRGIKTTVLGSRDQLCIHDKVSKEENNRVKSMMCRSMVSKHTCHYYNKWDTCNSDQLKEVYETSGKVLDIEDLVDIAKKNSHCPYFQAKSMKETAELILLPYNYLISPELRKIHEIELKGSIVIFDEAHNLESICEECTSVELTTTDIAICIKELQRAIEIMQEETELIRSQMDTTTESFGKVKEKKDEVAFEIGTAAAVLQILFDFEKAIDEYYKDELKKSKSYRDFPGKVAESHGTKIHDNKGYLHKLEGFISVVLTSHPVYEGIMNTLTNQMSYEQRKSENATRDFRLYLYKEKAKDSEEETNKIVIKYWCFSAGLAMQSLKQRGVRSVIVTSGTLSPLPNFMASIGLDFGCTLENTHAANSKQVVCGIVKKGNCLGSAVCELNGKYENRKNESYFIAIAHSLRDLAIKVPQGILVFFGSYGLMNATISLMQSKRKYVNSVWEEISLYKHIVVEPKNRRDLPACRMEFTQAVRNKNGAMFLAVCRGKVSEGIDFADADSRAVAVVGIPYPPLMDPRVKLKKLYLDEKREKNKMAQSGDIWYRMEAFRAVNQAIGRVLRHVDDFGIVALLDSRFATADFNMFSSWLRPSIRHFDHMIDFNKVTDRFFVERGTEILESTKKLKLMGSDAVAKTSRKRAVERNENYFFNYLTNDGEVEEIIQNNAPQGVETLASLGEKQDASTSTKRPEKVVVPDSFGAIEKSVSNQQPQRKKIRLVSRSTRIDVPSVVTINESPTPSRSSIIIEQVVEATSSVEVIRPSGDNPTQKLTKCDNLVVREEENVLPPEIKKILDLDDGEIKTMLKQLGTETYKHIIGVLKALNKGMEFGVIFKEMKRTLLPKHPQHLVAVSKYLNPEQRKQVLEECTKHL